jgi:alkanesulfonate monooxygenase SsuD/methylene tetrahydromethanopterin reductase-like flavin-dependent oxidoreductase (luciferase family)
VYDFSPAEQALVEDTMRTHAIGTPEVVRDVLETVARRTGADELIVSTRAHSYESRLQSLRLVAQVWGLEPVVQPIG